MAWAADLLDIRPGAEGRRPHDEKSSGLILAVVPGSALSQPGRYHYDAGVFQNFGWHPPRAGRAEGCAGLATRASLS